MRLFFAAELPRRPAADLAVWAAEATDGDRALRLVAIDLLHITLSFLGTVSPRDVDDLEAVLGDVVREQPWPSGLSFGEPLWLPPRRPHVLTASVEDPEGSLRAFPSSLAAALDGELGVRPEGRPFLPHVTVARLRRGHVPQSYALSAELAPGGPFAASAVTLFQSRLGTEGAEYTPLAQFRGEHA